MLSLISFSDASVATLCRLAFILVGDSKQIIIPLRIEVCRVSKRYKH